jgi:hypothetical protein
MKLLPATRGIVLAFLSLGLAALLNAHGLRKDAESRTGTDRRVAIALTRPLAHVSEFLRLDRPRHALQVAIGREDEDRIDTRVAFRLSPPAGPLPHRSRPLPQTRREKHESKVLPRPVFTPAHPLRIWVAGDSLAQVPGDALERATGSRREIDVVGVESRLSTGLGQPGLYNWFTRISTVIASIRPKVAVLSFGADDAHDYLGGVPGGRTIGKLGSPSWIAEYRRRIDGVTRELNAAGTYVVWIGLPIPAGQGFSQSFPVVNRILRGVTARHRTGAVYIDTWHMFDSAQGKYTDYLRNAKGKVVLLRARDGVHYLPPAGDMVARAILQSLGRVYDLSDSQASRAQG